MNGVGALEFHVIASAFLGFVSIPVRMSSRHPSLSKGASSASLVVGVGRRKSVALSCPAKDFGVGVGFGYLVWVFILSHHYHHVGAGLR